MSPLAPPPVDDAPMWSAWMAMFHAPTLAVADELHLFEALSAQPLTAAQLADALALEPRAAEALTGLLASLGFLTLEDERFALAAAARAYLLPASPYYWGGLLRRIRDIPVSCEKLLASLRGGPAAAQARLTAMWEAPTPPPQALVSFTHAMHAHSFSLAMRTITGFGLAGSMLDVGGGSGAYSIAAALHDPALRCTVLELAAVCPIAASYAAQHGVGDRVHTVAADMLAAPWPTGHDAILLADILHDWDDARCADLAKRAFAALAPGGRVLLHEMLLDEDKVGPATATSYSMLMVYVTQGRQRSGGELRALLAGAGFEAIRILPTANGYSLVEGIR